MPAPLERRDTRTSVKGTINTQPRNGQTLEDISVTKKKSWANSRMQINEPRFQAPSSQRGGLSSNSRRKSTSLRRKKNTMYHVARYKQPVGREINASRESGRQRRELLVLLSSSAKITCWGQTKPTESKCVCAAPGRQRLWGYSYNQGFADISGIRRTNTTQEQHACRNRSPRENNRKTKQQ